MKTPRRLLNIYLPRELSFSTDRLRNISTLSLKYYFKIIAHKQKLGFFSYDLISGHQKIISALNNEKTGLTQINSRNLNYIFLKFADKA